MGRTLFVEDDLLGVNPEANYLPLRALLAFLSATDSQTDVDVYGYALLNVINCLHRLAERDECKTIFSETRETHQRIGKPAQQVEVCFVQLPRVLGGVRLRV